MKENSCYLGVTWVLKNVTGAVTKVTLKMTDVTANVTPKTPMAPNKSGRCNKGNIISYIRIEISNEAIDCAIACDCLGV